MKRVRVQLMCVAAIIFAVDTCLSISFTRKELLSPDYPKCGKTQPLVSNFVSLRILGGFPAPPGEIPWAALLGTFIIPGGLRWVCGGNLISERHLLTAAHCNYPYNIKIVALGTDRLIQDGRYDPKAQIIKVDQIVIHPRYRLSPKDRINLNDIAIIKLRKKPRFGPLVHPICLPIAGNLNLEGNQALIFGWGKTISGMDELCKNDSERN